MKLRLKNSKTISLDKKFKLELSNPKNLAEKFVNLAKSEYPQTYKNLGL